MRVGHKEAQDLFLRLGESRGYRVRKQFSRRFPTDGIWLSRLHPDDADDLPIAAIEVICSESPKTVLGSIATLANVSPTLGVALLHEEEIARRMVRDGSAPTQVERAIAAATERIHAEIATSKQRIELWSFESLRWRCRFLQAPGRHFILAPTI